MPEKKYLGYGMKFPPAVNPATGRFITVQEEENVKQAVYIILMTQKGERFLLPEFGSNLMSYTFMNPTGTMLELMKHDIRTVLLEQEARISSVEVEIDPVIKDGCLMISIQYQIYNSYNKESMIFPFYLEGLLKEDTSE